MAGAVKRGMERGIGAIAGEDSRRGTRGQLAGGMVEVQVVEIRHSQGRRSLTNLEQAFVIVGRPSAVVSRRSVC